MNDSDFKDFVKKYVATNSFNPGKNDLFDGKICSIYGNYERVIKRLELKNIR